MSEQLKLCPFCGGKANLLRSLAAENVCIECGDCWASSRICHFRDKAYEEAEKECIAAWNRRWEPREGE